MTIERKINLYTAALGMRVCHERTFNRNTMILMDYIVLAMPGYVCTNRGPEPIEISDPELANVEE